MTIFREKNPQVVWVAPFEGLYLGMSCFLQIESDEQKQTCRMNPKEALDQRM